MDETMNDKKQKMAAVPKRRLHPTDGLAVTAKVWATAHGYHRRRLHAHQALAHAPGILTGLDVIASDPPDSTVYLLPGIALAPGGEFITVEAPVAYDLGTAEGALTLWLFFAEGQPQRESDPEAGDVAYVPAQFGVEAQPTHLSVEGVELARVRRTAGDAPLADTADPTYPSPNEIDLRFRRELQPPAAPAWLAVSRWGERETPSLQERGAQALGEALRHGGRTPLWVDVDVSVDGAFGDYTLLYLIVGTAEVETEALNALYDYLQNDGTVLLEVGTADEDGAVEAAVFDMLGSLGIALEPVPDDPPLLTTPHLFTVTPGAQPADPEHPALLTGGGVVFSRAQMGATWRGRRDGAALARAEIRAAHEWGENLIRYALTRSNED